MSGSGPLLTIGIPFRNEERYLGDAVRSILAQSWSNFELLLVDDGSTDTSLEVARSFRDERVTVISDGHRRFLPARLNEIVARARGELVVRMDGDDVSHPDRLRRELVALQAAGPEHAAVGSWVGLVNDHHEPFAVVEAAVPASPARALERGILPHATLMARRDWLRENPYDERLTRAEDRDLWCRTVTTTRFVVVPEPLYAIRVTSRHPTFLPDYLESQRQNRVLFMRYGPGILGWKSACRACASSWAKGVAMRGAVALGAADRLVKRRGRAPTDLERRLLLEALESGRQRP